MREVHVEQQHADEPNKEAAYSADKSEHDGAVRDGGECHEDSHELEVDAD